MQFGNNGAPTPMGRPAPMGGAPAPMGGAPAPMGGAPAPMGGAPAPMGAGAPTPMSGIPQPMGVAPAAAPTMSAGVVSLSKGQKVSLAKVAPALKNIMVGLGWDEQQFDNGYPFDLDAAAFLCGPNNMSSPENFIFYNNLVGAGGSVQHMGDNLTGNGDGDDEQIFVKLDQVPANIEKIAFTVTIHEANIRRQNFGQISNAFIRLVDNDTGSEVIRYDLTEDFGTETAIVVGELYRHNGEWKFSAVGAGFAGGLLALCKHYGIEATM